MHSDAHRKLPERVEKINYLIHGSRFDLFYYLTVLVHIPGGPFRFLINFGIVAVSFRFLTITPQRHSSHLPRSGVGGGGRGEKLDQAKRPRGPVQGPDAALGLQDGQLPNALSSTAHRRKQRPPSSRL